MSITAFQRQKLEELLADKKTILTAIKSGDTSFTLQGSITVNGKTTADMKEALASINAEIRAILKDITGNSLNELEYEAQ